LRNKPFSLLIKPASADCNLRCAYCFYLDRKELYPQTSRHRMSDEVLERMISTYMATDQPAYSFGWQGGEPTLMGESFFRRLTELQKEHGKPGSVVANGLQTNATLITDDMAEHLGRYHFLIGVSLDGPEEIHDRYRRTIDGRGSHRQVLQGIERLRRNRVEYNILTLVSAANVEEPARVYRYLMERGEMYHQYIPCVEFDDDGSPLPYTISGEQWGRFLCGIFDQWRASDTARVSIRLFDSILALMVDGQPNVCSMRTNCCQYFVVEHNGDVYPCDFFVQKDLYLGNVMTHSWDELMRSPVYRAFGERKRRWNRRCDSCPYLAFCAGDCQKQRYYGSEDPGQASHLCAGWRMFYEKTLPEFERLAARVRSMRARSARSPGRDGARTEPGRNDPCFCGSGKKYKHCHGR